MRYKDRIDAGKILGRELIHYKSEGPLVLAVPRGGVEIGYEVASILEAPLDIIIVRKLGAPGQTELAMGAVVDGDNPQTVLNEDVMRALNVSQEYLDHEVELELKEIERRQNVYLKGHPSEPVEGKTVILVDDGIATGASIRAAIRGLRRKHPDKIILAVPVAPPETVESLKSEVDELLCLATPAFFSAVGMHYENFDQTTDEKVIKLIDLARKQAASFKGD